jgi:hypothetical protein
MSIDVLPLQHVLSDKYGREFIIQLLRECGVDIVSGISFRKEKTAHEIGLDLLQEIMYNHNSQLRQMVSDLKTQVEENNGRGNNIDSDSDD